MCPPGPIQRMRHRASGRVSQFQRKAPDSGWDVGRPRSADVGKVGVSVVIGIVMHTHGV
jgi:hypothetical protein